MEDQRIERPKWITEDFRCIECFMIQWVDVPEVRNNRSAIVHVKEYHLEDCSRFENNDHRTRIW